MPQPINILIVEDELLILEDLNELLSEAGYTHITKASDYHQAVESLSRQSFDLVLLDINLGKEKSGIDLAHHINNHYTVPFIYLTSYSDSHTIQYLKPTRPSAFLTKPYNKELLLASIEIALYNFSMSQDATRETMAEQNPDHNIVMNGHLLLKEHYRYIKIPLMDILWFESDKNYVTVKTSMKKYLLRSSLKKLLEQLPPDDFAKCYKQYIINVRHAENFTADSVSISGQEIPISRYMQQEVLRKLKQ